jgi:hypothetical protein
MADEEVPASPEVVAQAVAEARAVLAQSTRPRPVRPSAETRIDAPLSRPSPSQDEALSNLYAALRRLRAAVSEVEAALAEASLYLPDERTDSDE